MKIDLRKAFSWVHFSLLWVSWDSFLREIEMRKTADEGFIQTYVRYTKELQAPECFHEWVAISVVLSMLSRRVWVDRKLYILYPNEYVLLIGPSGIGKDTAIDVGLDFLRACPNHPEFFPGRLSASSLMGHLHVLCSKKVPETGERLDASIYLKAPEFAAFVGSHPMNYDLLAALTELYKSPDEFPYVTRAHGWEALHNVCINLLGGSTQKWLKTAIPDSAIGGGFTARVVFVDSNEPRPRKAIPGLPRDHRKMRENMVYDLTAIGMIGGEMHLTTDAENWARDWYETLPRFSEDNVLAPYYERKLDHIVKVAMGLSAMQGNERFITPSHLLTARDYLERAEGGARKILVGFELTEISERHQRILKVIRKAGTISRVDLQRRIVRWANKALLDEALETLIPNYVTMKMGGSTGRQTIYEATDLPEDDGY